MTCRGSLENKKSEWGLLRPPVYHGTLSRVNGTFNVPTPLFPPPPLTRPISYFRCFGYSFVMSSIKYKTISISIFAYPFVMVYWLKVYLMNLQWFICTWFSLWNGICIIIFSDDFFVSQFDIYVSILLLLLFFWYECLLVYQKIIKNCLFHLNLI